MWRSVGRIGGRALIYFEVVSTFALFVGLAVAVVFKPGAGFNVSRGSLDAGAVSQYVAQARTMTSVADWLLHLVPDTFVSAFSTGESLQVLLLALLTGFAIAAVERGRRPDRGRARPRRGRCSSPS